MMNVNEIQRDCIEQALFPVGKSSVCAISHILWEKQAECVTFKQFLQPMAPH